MPLKHLVQFQFLEGKSAGLIVETCAEFSIVLFLLISTQHQYEVTEVLLHQDSLVEDLVGSQSQFSGSELPGFLSSLSQPRANVNFGLCQLALAVGWGMLGCRMSWPFCPYIFREISAPFCAAGVGLNLLTEVKLSLTVKECWIHLHKSN